MDTDEKPFMTHFEKLSFSEIQDLFQNLKHIGMTDEDIDKYSKEYYEFFDKLNKDRGASLSNISIYSRKPLTESKKQEDE